MLLITRVEKGNVFHMVSVQLIQSNGVEPANEE